MLKKANDYVKSNYKEESNRPKFHFNSPVGWINDPNGFSVYKGEYHLFYQYHPYSMNWGPMHWGHCKTNDFIKWENLDIALAPDENFDNFGCYSGTAIEYDDKHIIMYTGVFRENYEERQVQCIAIGDGVNYKKSKNNPVITSDLLPKNSSKVDFRDPKLFKDKDTYYSLVANKSEDGSGQLLLFSSTDLNEWKFLNILDKSNNEIGKMWECPDIFNLDDKTIILVSPQNMQATELEFHNGHNTIYLLGELDNNYKFTREIVGKIDYGLDFYAPQSIKTLDGRRIVIGWLQSWDNHILHDDCNWTGIMSLPRELTIKDNKIYQMPIKEISNYYDKTYSIEGEFIGQDLSFKNINGRYIDLFLDINIESDTIFLIKFACDDKFYSSISYNSNTEIFTIDRTYSGLKNDVLTKRDVSVKSIDGILKLRIILDRYSSEIFINEGEKVVSMLFSTDINAKDIKFSFNRKTKISVVNNIIDVN